MGRRDGPIEIVPAEETEESGGLFYSREWLGVLGDAFPLVFFATRSSVPGERIVFATRQDLMEGLIVSLPFSDYTAPGIDGETLRAHAGAIVEQFSGASIVIRLAREGAGPLGADGWEEERPAVYHALSLSSEEDLWGGLSPSFRRAVRRGGEANVEVAWSADVKAVERFYAIYVEHRRRKFGVLSPPYSFFRSIFHRFIEAGRGFVVEATLEGKPVSSAIVLAHGRSLHYKFGASDLDALAHRPNNVLFWELARGAFRKGFADLDLGLSWCSDDDQGVRRFKEGLGAEAHPAAVLRRTPPGYDRAGEEMLRELLRGVTRQMVAGPLTVEQADGIGDLLFRYFV